MFMYIYLTEVRRTSPQESWDWKGGMAIASKIPTYKVTSLKEASATELVEELSMCSMK